MDIPDKVNNVDTYEAPEFNEFKNEVQNAILSSNQALASSSIQLKQALARYASNGASFTENGSANAYNLIAIGNNDILTTYRDGDFFTFVAGNANTGASTLSINGLGTRTIKKNGFANDLVSGDIEAGKLYCVYYSLSNDEFEFVSLSNSFQKYTYGSNANGSYRIWDNGLIEQWITTGTLSAGTSIITLPVSFISSMDTVIPTPKRGSGLSGNLVFYWDDSSSTLSEVAVINDASTGTPSSECCIYLKGF